METLDFYNSIPPKFHVKNLTLNSTYQESNDSPKVKYYLSLENDIVFDSTIYVRETTNILKQNKYIKKETYIYPPLEDLQSSSYDYTLTYQDGDQTVSYFFSNKIYTVQKTTNIEYLNT